MKRTITVLQDDIDNGEKKVPYKCAIARAAHRDLADLLSEDCTVHATTRLCLAVRGRTYMRADMPPEAVDFIRDFDSDAPVWPFKFEVDLHEQRSQP